jgi:ABC-2 type transport system ATP-binding protein
VIALGTPPELIGSLGAEHVVDFAIAGDGAAVNEETLRQIAGVQAVRHSNTGYELQVGELHRTLPALLSLLGERRLELSQLTTHSATLEDVFVSLTGRQLRDE